MNIKSYIFMSLHRKLIILYIYIYELVLYIKQMTLLEIIQLPEIKPVSENLEYKVTV